MRKKVSPTLIGLFIAVALILGIAGVLIFSSSKLFTRTSQYILYFDASLKGLEPGTAVKFRGVTIGVVKQILIHFNQEPADSSLPVIIEINEDLLEKKIDIAFGKGAGSSPIETYIKRGLRGKLESQSLLTGLLYIDMEFLPETAEKYHQLKPLETEIPTTPSQAQIFIQDFAEITQKLNTTLGRLNTSLGELQMKEVNRGLTNLLTSLNGLVGSPELTNTLISARQSLDELHLLSKDLRFRVDELTIAANSTLAESRDTLAEARTGVQDLRDVISPQGEIRRDLTTTLQDLSEAARSVSALADFLNQHPNALLSGRKVSEPKK